MSIQNRFEEFINNHTSMLYDLIRCDVDGKEYKDPNTQQAYIFFTIGFREAVNGVVGYLKDVEK